MIIRKMWLLRTGKIVPGSYEEADWTDLSIESIKSYTLELIKIAIHKIILLCLKGWILFTNLIKRIDKKIKDNFIHLIHKNENYNINTDQKPSDFLSDIKEHKEKMLEGIQKED